MASQTKTASSFGQSGSDLAWSISGTNADAGQSGNATTNVLQFSSMGFTIPTGAFITGIEATVTHSSLNGSLATDVTVELAASGASFPTNQASGAFWPTSSGSAGYGSPVDLWGYSGALDPVTVNDNSLTLGVSASLGGANTIHITGASVTITYNPPAGGPPTSPAIMMSM